MKHNIWLMAYSNFHCGNYNPSKGLAFQVRQSLRKKSSAEKQYICRIKRVGVNIYDADEAVDEVEFLDNSGQFQIDAVIAFGVGGPQGLFKFEHTGSAARNEISDQYDLYGRPVNKKLQEYGAKIEGQTAGWHYNERVHNLVRTYEQKAGQDSESPGAGSYLCGYMTEKLAVSQTLTNKGFFIHTKNYFPTEEDLDRNRAGLLIADFIEEFCDLPKLG
ncbi:hypothetical protein [Moorena sp. SIO4G3]|uniref:hypothetical protein n=1 Tax=Moorena sp. SIO4G3 TaxID=2607821 RepID=UPI001429CBB8|nr:hypothetical protein [Moorena sp. SIO4G3]NEO81976.1 hypothetical protein [Moorena sp. SIO4G3]